MQVNHLKKYVKQTNKQTNFRKKLIILELYQNQNSDKVWFIIYADLECFIEKIDSCKNNAKNSTKIKVAKHIRLKIKVAKHIIILTLLAPEWVGVEGGWGTMYQRGIFLSRTFERQMILNWNFVTFNIFSWWIKCWNSV